MKKLEHLQASLAQMRANLKAAQTLTDNERAFMTQVHDILDSLLNDVSTDIQDIKAENVRLKNELAALKSWFDDHDVDATFHRIQ